MNKINIGTEIDLEDLLQSRMLIQANSGGGKSVTARVIMEESFGKVPFITFDRDGEYYTLKEALPDVVVIGGSFPDLPIDLASAALLPKEIVSARLSVVIDLSDLKSGQKQQYVKDFLEALMDLPQEYWTGYLVFIEEAHFFCGEQDKNPAGSAVRELMSGGRKKGYCGILITQRISKLHKDAAAECNNKFVGRTNLDIDMDRAAKELGFSSPKDRVKLRDLAPGRFWAYGTSIEPHHVHEVKIKLPRTKQPKAGTITTIKLGKPTTKVLEVLKKLGGLPTQTKDTKNGNSSLLTEQANENSQLKSQLVELREEVIEKDKSIGAMLNRIRYNDNIFESITALLLGEPPPFDKNIDPPLSVTMTGFVGRNEKIDPKQHRKATNPTTINASGISKCGRSILQFLASFPDRSFSKAQVGVATSYSPNSGSFNNALSELNGKGAITRDGARLQIKDRSTIDQFFGSDFEPQKYSLYTYMEKLNKCEREIYQVLLQNPKAIFDKEAIAAETATGYSPTSGSFNNALSKLNTLELICRKNSMIILNPELLEI